ncbi:MAG: radical SAM protein, partial [Clostridia bacterium]|nr:radical SAM protein [Clostridia bacterium]
MSRHVNIPIFIPHLGCPNQCVFCNQRTICGRDAFRADSIRAEIESVLSTVSPDDECEIAFFGGSFTGIDRGLMVDLLTIAKEYVDKGFVRSVRCSTRPDYINEEIINLLREYSVNTVELGLQSSSDSVLALSKRGHNRIDEERACRLLVDNKFSLVGQMMIGLPGSSLESELETAEFIASVGAEYARIYPTVVFQDTELCKMAKSAIYTPLSLDDAIERSCAVYSYFLRKGVKVIRVGLCSSDNLVDDSKYFAGPNHPALGELVL